MQRLVTASEIRTLDQRAVTEGGITGETLMENAGRCVVETIERQLGALTGHRPLVVCGRGNNGGDGFVVARLLAGRGIRVRCALLGSRNEIRGDARAAAERLAAAGQKITEISCGNDLKQLLADCDIVVDAIVGTGFAAKPLGLVSDAIDLINSSDATVFSVDIPSGVDSDTGATYGPAVQAEHTITMGLSKLGLWLYPGRALAGRVHVADIGFPARLVSEPGNAYLTEETDVVRLLPPRPAHGHKGTFGTALIVAGSGSMAGAACLCAMGAVRSGAGLVRLAVPHSVAPEITAQTADPVKLLLPETETRTLSLAALEPLLAAVATADAVAVGPGLTTESEVCNLVLQLLPQLRSPVVIDADGINALVRNLDILDSLKVTAVVTPHPGEMSRLINKPSSDVTLKRVEVARQFAVEHRCVTVLKGAATVISAPDGRVFVNPTGNSGLATGGTGDVLTGMIVGLIAQGASPLDAAIAAAFLHGRAADIAATRLTEYCMCAHDLPDFLPAAFLQVTEQIKN